MIITSHLRVCIYLLFTVWLHLVMGDRWPQHRPNVRPCSLIEGRFGAQP